MMIRFMTGLIMICIPGGDESSHGRQWRIESGIDELLS